MQSKEETPEEKALSTLNSIREVVKELESRLGECKGLSDEQKIELDAMIHNEKRMRS